MKHLFTILSALALLTFAVPAFACDGHKKVDKGDETTTTASEETAKDGHACTADCDHEDKAKKKTKTEEGEV